MLKWDKYDLSPLVVYIKTIIFVYLKKYTHCDSESEDGIECFSASAGIWKM